MKWNRRRKHPNTKLDVSDHLPIKSWTNPSCMLVGNTMDNMPTSWHGQTCPFDVNTPILSFTSDTVRLYFILHLYMRSTNNSATRKMIWLMKFPGVKHKPHKISTFCFQKLTTSKTYSPVLCSTQLFNEINLTTLLTPVSWSIPHT